jgi:hypothetical protein
MNSNFDLEQLNLAIRYYERKLEELWWTEKADSCTRNIKELKTKYNELSNEKKKADRVS